MMSDKEWAIDLQNITDTLKSVIEKMSKSASRSLKKRNRKKKMSAISQKKSHLDLRKVRPDIKTTMIFANPSFSLTTPP